MKYLSLVYCLLASHFLLGQLPNDDLAAYLRAKDGLFLLGNSQQLLPLQGLDTLRPALLTDGMADDSELYNALNAYVPTAKLVFDRKNGLVTQWGFPHEKPYNLLLLAMGEDEIQLPWETIFQQGTPVIFLVFGDKMLDVFSAAPMQDQHFIFSRYQDAWAQSLVAQLAFGAIGSASRQVGAHALNSIALAPCQRLAFAPTAAVGMDGALLKDSISAILQEGIEAGAFPGAQVLVAKNGTIVYHQAFGYHTAATDQPVSLTDIYDLASITKITAGLPVLLKWYGEGTLDLDAPLHQYYPAAAGTNKADLTLRNMLAHQARLRPWIPFWQGTLRGNAKYPWKKRWDTARINDYRFRRNTFATDSSAQYNVYVTDKLWLHETYRTQLFESILQSPLNDKQEYRYSDLTFILLPELITHRTGVPFETYIRQTFYRPLGAYTLAYNPLRYFPASRIVPTERDTFFRHVQIHGHVHDEGAAMLGGVSGHAGLFAQAFDLAKVMQLYLNGGTYGGQRYFAQAAVDTFTSRPFAAAGNYRGLGFDKPLLAYDAANSTVAKAASPASFGHGGYTGTFTWADPDNGLLFVFLSNRVYPTRNNRVLYQRSIRPRLHTVIYDAVKE